MANAASSHRSGARGAAGHVVQPRARPKFLRGTAVAALALVASAASATPRETVLHTFLGGKDGAYPAAAVIADSSGAYYGTTEFGGGAAACAGGCGIVYKLTKGVHGFTETVLYRFKGATDGANPTGSLLLDKGGDIFGTTVNGGSVNCTNGCGTVFELIPKTGGGYKKHTIYAFKNSPDGANPQSALLALGGGVLLGTTGNGGSSGYGCYGPANTCGTVFKLAPTATGYKESVAYAFQPPPDASAPDSTLIESGGSIFGVGLNGGTNGCVAPNYTCGTVFSLTPVGGGYAESVLTVDGWNGAGGPNPVGGLVSDKNQNLYGVALNAYSANGDVFALTPGSDGYGQSYIHKFTGSPDGSVPESAPIVDGSGNVFGTTNKGGSTDCNCGMIYELSPGSSSYTETILLTFERGAGGTYPIGSLLKTSGGDFIGVASEGGSTVKCASGCGVVFKLRP